MEMIWQKTIGNYLHQRCRAGCRRVVAVEMGKAGWGILLVVEDGFDHSLEF